MRDPAHYAFEHGLDGSWRDLWWNDGFLDLMARRWQLGQLTRALDVGCGAGHWGLRLLKWLAPGAALTGVDVVQSFVDGAVRAAREQGVGHRFEGHVADAYDLPFPDGIFDFVTCQTVLIHARDPANMLAEMVRVLRPGGLLAVAEPNNVANAAIGLAQLHTVPLSERLRVFEFEVVCNEGRRVLGCGDGALGEQLPGLFRRVELDGIEVYSSDRCLTLLAPYVTRAEQHDIEQFRRWTEAGLVLAGGTRQQTLERYVAGGGDAAAFDELFTLALAHQEAMLDALEAQQIQVSRGALHYLVSGRKPDLRTYTPPPIKVLR